jgi:hypothetical protein
LAQREEHRVARGQMLAFNSQKLSGMIIMIFSQLRMRQEHIVYGGPKNIRELTKVLLDCITNKTQRTKQKSKTKPPNTVVLVKKESPS